MTTVQIIMDGAIKWSWDIPEGPCLKGCPGGRYHLEIGKFREYSDVHQLEQVKITIALCEHGRQKATE